MGWHAASTLGSVIIGLGLLILNIGGAWPGYKRFRKQPLAFFSTLIPFTFGYLYGTALILCAGGLLGWIANLALWGSGWIGDSALIWGVGGQREDVTRAGTATVLTNGGLAMVLILAFVVVVIMRKRADDKRAISQGMLAGVLLGTVRGVAGILAVPVASGLNLAGAWLSTGVVH